jgi:hypothetical protein
VEVLATRSLAVPHTAAKVVGTEKVAAAVFAAVGSTVRIGLTAGSFEPGNRAGAQLVAAMARAVAAATRFRVLVRFIEVRLAGALVMAGSRRCSAVGSLVCSWHHSVAAGRATR